MKPIVIAALVVLLSSSVFAQSRVTDILIEQSNVAARAALQRAEIWNRVIADLTVAPLVLFPPRPVFVPPPVVAPVAPVPPASAMQQRYLEEALAYLREQDAARALAPRIWTAEEMYFAQVRSEIVPVAAADCGLKPLKPLPPLGCRDLVAQCVIDPQGHAYWQWVCVR